MPRTPTTQLVTVLFTDIVASTEIASELGDRRWRALVAAHHGLVRQALRRHRGRELDTAGDGFFASFGRPADAIRCAVEVADGVREFGLEIRAGIHLGEAEIMGGKVGGLVVNTGARIMALGTAGEVLVSATVRDAVAGKGIGFTDHGVHQLKGIEGEHRVVVVSTVDGEVVAPPLDPAEARRRRELPPQAPATRRRWIVAAVATVAIVVAGVAALSTWTEADPDRAPASPSTSTGRTMTRADELLVELVPEAIATSCAASDPVPPEAVAAVTCADGEIVVSYAGYRSADALGEAYALSTAGVQPEGTSCVEDRTAAHTYEVNGQPRGSITCYIREELLSSAPTIVWTDTQLLVLGTASREVGTSFAGSVPDLSLYEWWRTAAGPTDTGALPVKGDPLPELPSGTFRISIAPSDVERGVDPKFEGTTVVTLDAPDFHVTYPRGAPLNGWNWSDGALLWGKENRLVVRVDDPLGDDFTGQCPRWESWRWRLDGDRLILDRPSPETNCNDLRNLLSSEPLERV